MITFRWDDLELEPQTMDAKLRTVESLLAGVADRMGIAVPSGGRRARSRRDRIADQAARDQIAPGLGFAEPGPGLTIFFDLVDQPEIGLLGHGLVVQPNGDRLNGWRGRIGQITGPQHLITAFYARYGSVVGAADRELMIVDGPIVHRFLGFVISAIGISAAAGDMAISQNVDFVATHRHIEQVEVPG